MNREARWNDQNCFECDKQVNGRICDVCSNDQLEVPKTYRKVDMWDACDCLRELDEFKNKGQLRYAVELIDKEVPNYIISEAIDDATRDYLDYEILDLSKFASDGRVLCEDLSWLRDDIRKLPASKKGFRKASYLLDFKAPKLREKNIATVKSLSIPEASRTTETVLLAMVGVFSASSAQEWIDNEIIIKGHGSVLHVGNAYLNDLRNTFYKSFVHFLIDSIKHSALHLAQERQGFLFLKEKRRLEAQELLQQGRIS